MANTGSPSRRAAGGGRRCGSLTRVDILTFLLAAMLCSASYCLGIWHNIRGAADSSVLGPSAVVAGATSCGGDADEPLDFEAHHTAEGARLSVSAVAAATTTTTNARRALRGAAPGTTGHRGEFPWPASRSVAWAGNSARGAAEAAAGERWAALVDGDSLWFPDAGAVRA